MEGEGAITGIESLDDIPGKLLETILEGLAKEPSKWMVMGLGFYLGWKGIDVLQWFTMTIGRKAEEAGSALLKANIQFDAFVINTGFDLLRFLRGTIGGPLKPGEAGPETTYTDDDGVVHKGRGYSAPTQNTLKELEQKPPASDGGPSEYEKWKADFDAHMIAGAIGALTAVMITQPGFVQGVGEIVKGVGEIVPF